jgi:pimeloyl-ACP methyl ester carboxylesterase
MEPFTLTLANGGTVTGLANLPAASTTTPRFKPLMVGLHGGSYSSAYFDVDEKHTAALASDGLGVPWVAVDRPGYKGSTSLKFNPITIPENPDRSSYHEVLGEWLHRYILPALWQAFGEPQGCNSMVLLCHSLGVPGAVVAAALLAREEAEDAGNRNPPGYPLAGIIASGFGTQASGDGSSSSSSSGDDEDNRLRTPAPNEGQKEDEPELITFPAKVKDTLMLPAGTCDEAVYAHTARLNEPFPARERDDALPQSRFARRFGAHWAPLVRVPVMMAVAERDPWWKADDEHARHLAALFTRSAKAEAGVIRGAPHNLEMSHWAPAWYARCFGFGMECAVGFALAG